MRKPIEHDDHNVPRHGDNTTVLRDRGSGMLLTTLLATLAALVTVVALDGLRPAHRVQEILQRHGRLLLPLPQAVVELRLRAQQRQPQRGVGHPVHLQASRALVALAPRVHAHAADSTDHIRLGTRRNGGALAMEQGTEALLQGLQHAAEKLVGVLLLATCVLRIDGCDGLLQIPQGAVRPLESSAGRAPVLPGEVLEAPAESRLRGQHRVAEVTES
mmetsp:Transcript_126121/g.365015  ORF Transcript_126121/g.365015 Transcript_126121/m.365015 type:complete len:217 (+) Transcript_126121:2229-2879(+)